MFSTACALPCPRMWLGLGCRLPAPQTVCCNAEQQEDIHPAPPKKRVFQAVSDCATVYQFRIASENLGLLRDQNLLWKSLKFQNSEIF